MKLIMNGKELKQILGDQFTGLTFGEMSSSKGGMPEVKFALNDEDEVELEVTGY